MDRTTLLKNGVGGLLMGVGCILFLAAEVGADPLTTCSQGIEKVSHFSFTLSYYGLNGAMLLLAYVIDKKQVGWGSLLFPLASGAVLHIGEEFMFAWTVAGRWGMFFAGIVLISFAIAVASGADCGKNPYDALIFSIMDKIKKDYRVVRTAFDVILLVLGILMGGLWGIGTVLAVLLIGMGASAFMKLMNARKQDGVRGRHAT